jgi:hypothetical protein
LLSSSSFCCPCDTNKYLTQTHKPRCQGTYCFRSTETVSPHAHKMSNLAQSLNQPKGSCLLRKYYIMLATAKANCYQESYSEEQPLRADEATPSSRITNLIQHLKSYKSSHIIGSNENPYLCFPLPMRVHFQFLDLLKRDRGL